MADKAKGFDILKETLGVQVCKHFDDDGYYYLECNHIDTSMSEEDGDCLIKCLNAEEDSMDKIIEEFKELGYECKQFKNCIRFTKQDNEIRIFKDGRLDILIYDDYLYSNELRLINRILRLWGVEV